MSALVLVAALAACTSPEAKRTRASGPGADIGNRAGEVMMHEGSLPFAGTPVQVPGSAAPVETATHAHRLSTRR